MVLVLVAGGISSAAGEEVLVGRRERSFVGWYRTYAQLPMAAYLELTGWDWGDRGGEDRER